MRVGFAGAGNMAGAMARGWAAGTGGPDAMLFCDLDRERAEALAAEVGGEVIGDLRTLAERSDAVVLAVKPAALDEVAPELLEARAAVSVLAATATSRVGAALPGVPILRVMPNQPVEVRRGVLCFARGPELPDELAERLLSLLGALGALVEVPEEQLEAAMAVMSCSPAYVAVVAGSLADAGAAEGLDPKLSAELVAQTLAGTAELLRKRDPEAIRAAVAPPGGATEAGLEELSERGVEAAFAAAVDASLERFR